MKKITIINKAFALLVLAAAIATPLFAQNKKDSSGDEKKEQWIELSKTNKNHKLLAGMTGEWSFTGRHIFHDTTKKSVEFKGTVTKKALWDGRYFITETTSGGKLKMPWAEGELITYHDMTIEGYDNVRKKFFTSTISNESNTGIITLEGSYDPAIKTITYEGESISHMHRDIAAGTMMKFHVLVKLIDPDHFIIEHHEIIAGQEEVVTELKYTRIKSGKVN